ncbi:MAG: hypothetical protein RL708_711 [Bacteroidota bacterium]|jgi:predicted AAA+ superfamily ATPase
MIQRTAEKRLKYLAKKFRVVAVVGPRQSGKTTLCKSVFSNKKYVSLENPDTFHYAKTDPNSFLKQFSNGAIIDEAQKLPELFSYIQQIVDEKNKAGLFILSGSNNFLMQQSISQSLAGRVAYLHLLPLSHHELKAAKKLGNDFEKNIFRGYYPEIISKKISPNDWYANYVNTYVERDVRQLVNINNLGLFIKFLKLCAGRVGQILNVHALAADCGVDNKTINSWLQVLQTSYIVYLLKPFYNNYNKRILQSPKLYFYDTGLACFLLGITEQHLLDNNAYKGALFENMLIIDALKNNLNEGLPDNFFYWRDKTGLEVDLVLDSKPKTTFVEIKSGATINSDFFKSLLKLNELNDGKANLKLIYGGNTNSVRSNNVEVFSWKNVKL